MTIRFLMQWNGYSPDQIVSGLGSTEEARLIGLGFASADLDGANDGVVSDVKMRTDASGNTVLVGADGSPLLTFEEPSKNIIANVNLRTGALDTLLTFAGGAGEVGVATDVDAMVRYTGVQGQAKAFYRNSVLYEALLGVTSTAISATASTFTGLTLNDDGGDMVLLGAPVIWTAGAPDEIVLPATAGKYAVTFEGLWTFSANATGTVRRLRVEAWSGSAWVSVSSIATNISTDATNSSTNPVAVHAAVTGVGVTAYNRFRIAAASTAGVALNVAAQGVIKVIVRRVD